MRKLNNGTGTIINSWLELASNITVEISPNYNIDNTDNFFLVYLYLFTFKNS